MRILKMASSHRTGSAYRCGECPAECGRGYLSLVR